MPKISKLKPAIYAVNTLINYLKTEFESKKKHCEVVIEFQCLAFFNPSQRGKYAFESKEDGNDQETIQSSTRPDLGYHMFCFLFILHFLSKIRCTVTTFKNRLSLWSLVPHQGFPKIPRIISYL